MKLAPAQVIELIDAWQAGVSQADLAERYGIAQQTVGYHIRRHVGARPGETVRRSGVDRATLTDIRTLAEEALKAQIHSERRLRALLAALEPRDKAVSSESLDQDEAERRLVATIFPNES